MFEAIVTLCLGLDCQTVKRPACFATEQVCQTETARALGPLGFRRGCPYELRSIVCKPVK